MSSESFSLLDNPWISCAMSDGSTRLLSIRDVFRSDESVRGIRGDSPAQDYAVLRLLLAIYWRAHQANPRRFSFDDWFNEQRVSLDTEDEKALEYLSRFEDRFNLFDETAPFMQVATLATASGKRDPINRIIPEAEDEYFTMRAGSGIDSLSPEEAARWLVYVQAYDYSGIKSGAVGDPRVKGGKGYPIGTGWCGFTGGTVVVGACLRDTLTLNTTSTALSTAEDHPVWERTPDTAEQRENPLDKEGPMPKGPADLATWQSRRVRLFTEDGVVTGVLVSNGDRIPKAGLNIKSDPMTPYRYSSNKSKQGPDAYYPAPYQVERTIWRSLEPLILLEGDLKMSGKNRPPKRPATLSNLAELERDGADVPRNLQIELISVAYGAQSSSVDTTVHATIELPTHVLEESSTSQRRAILRAAEATRESAVALGSFAGQLLVDAGGDYAYQPAVTDALLTRLQPQFLDWLQGSDAEDLESQEIAWQRQVKDSVLAEAKTLLIGAGPKALVGRVIEDSDGKKQLRAAGKTFRWLQAKLRAALPLLPEHQNQEMKEKK